MIREGSQGIVSISFFFAVRVFSPYLNYLGLPHTLGLFSFTSLLSGFPNHRCLVAWSVGGGGRLSGGAFGFPIVAKGSCKYGST